MIVLEPAARRELCAHAVVAWPEECCGFLLGSDGHVRETVPAANRAADPRRGFRLDPRDGLRALGVARRRGLEVVGFYHSHPGGEPRPSSTDEAAAIPGSLHAVIPASEGRAGEPRLWRAGPGGFRPADDTPRSVP
jgi:proteasome lid subunit RPN8/RPN11